MSTRIPAVVLAGLLLGLLLAPAPASAHSFLREAKPGVDATVQRGPKRVALWFNERVEAEFARITVTTRKGQRLRATQPLPLRGAEDALAVRLPRRPPRGRYIVTWRVVSADSHIQSGRFRFRVKGVAQEARKPKPAAPPVVASGGDGAGGGSVTAPESAAGAAMAGGTSHAANLVATARGVTTAGLLLLVGLIAFWLLAWRGIGPALAPAGDVQQAFIRRWQRMASVALAVTAVGTITGVVMQGAAAANVAVAQALRAEVIEGVLSTGFGKAAVGRLVLLELLAVLAVLWRAVPLFTHARPARAVGAAALEPGISGRRLLLLTAVVLPLMLTMSLVSHAASASPVWLHLTADAVHFAAAGAWIGGLVVLGFAAFPATRGLAPAERLGVLGPPVIRFSRIAAVSVALVVVTGTIRGLDTVGGWTGLTSSAYGRALLIKLGVFSVLLAVGAFNHFWAVRRIHAAVLAGTQTTALAALRRSVALETLLSTVIVVTTAVLVSLPPA